MMADKDKIYPCVTCTKPVNDDRLGGIECCRCELWTHGTASCTKLPRELVILMMKQDSNVKKGTGFFCVLCRKMSCPVLSPSKVTQQVDSNFQEMCRSIVNLTESVKNLTFEVANLKLEQSNMLAKQSSVDRSVGEMRQEINGLREDMVKANRMPFSDVGGDSMSIIQNTMREEVKELHERDKRRTSVVIKGIPFSESEDKFLEDFRRVVSCFWPDSPAIRLVEIFPIRPNLVRAKIADHNIRNELLSRSKLLKSSNYSSVFISRDLTYRQRKDLKDRRLNRNLVGGGGERQASGGATGVAALTRGFENIRGSPAGGSGGVASEVPNIAVPSGAVSRSGFERLSRNKKKNFRDSL